MKQLVILCFFCIGLFGQVAPFKIPYDISSKYSTPLNLNNIFNFKDSDKLRISKTDDYVWQKKIEIDKESRIILKIENNANCEGALFLKNSKEEISGPYQISRIKKTNPFKGRKIEIQFIPNNDCDVKHIEFTVDYYENNMYGVSFNVSDDLTLSYAVNKSDRVFTSGQGTNQETEASSFQLAYTMGGASVKIAETSVDNWGYQTTTAFDRDGTTVSLSLAF